MNTIFMNPENSITSDSRRLLLNISDKLDLKRSNKYVTLLNHSIYNTLKDIKISYKNNKFKLTAKMWNDKVELPDRSCSDHVHNMTGMTDHIRSC